MYPMLMSSLATERVATLRRLAGHRRGLEGSRRWRARPTPTR
jgi:hypothetical protein